MKELYWVANYTDGTKLTQYEDGVEKKYTDIDRDRLARFDLCDIETAKPVHAVFIREGKSLIYRRRTLMKTTGQKIVIYLVGWKQTINGKTDIVINYVHPDGSVALDGERNNLQLLEFE